MKQVLEEIGSGKIKVLDVPAPLLRPGTVLVRTAFSVISIGTDRTQIAFGRKSLVGKALEKPEQIRQVANSVLRDGLGRTVRRVREGLSRLTPLGYSSSGVIEAVAADVHDLRVGQRVACAGAGYASHAELVVVPRQLVAVVPEDVALDQAAFATLGAIALHGVRQAGPQLGETVAVIGLGLLGQLTMQILNASGVKPIGIDVAAERVRLARELGGRAFLRSDAPVERILDESGGIGADAIIITAATQSDDPVRLAGALARDRARVVVVGDVAINVPRSPFYEKEIDVRLSRSYGPGRYDLTYEQRGIDYPIGFVRWTERRNLQAFLELLARGCLRLEPLVSSRFYLADAAAAYASLSAPAGGRPLGVVIEYPQTTLPEPRRIPVVAAEPRSNGQGTVGIGVIGAGAFATDTILPILRRMPGIRRVGVVTAGGVSARVAAERFGFDYAASDAEALLSDPAIHAIIIATRHDDHASLAAAALRAGKAVYVEKPLALDRESLDDVLQAASSGGVLMVGFNRRFAPATAFIREHLQRTTGTRMINIRVNAGQLPPDSWIHDLTVGGGRLVADGCHFVDLAMYLADSPIAHLHTAFAACRGARMRLRENFSLTLSFESGALATIAYTSVGNGRSAKERIEVFSGNQSFLIDDFKYAEIQAERRQRWRGRQDKGHATALSAFVASVSDGEPRIPLNDIARTSQALLQAAARL